MESADEGLDNIFEDNQSRENGGGEEANGMEIDGEYNNEASTGVKIQPPTKRVIKNPRLKFNPERLCGERGIPIVVDHFKNVKFKGNGYEKEDLDKLLSRLEHWTHRLFPSMKFGDCLRHIEKLGKKRPVQTCLRKIRLDMPILNSDFVKDNEEEEDNVQRNEDADSVEVDAFDRLIGENQNFNPPTTVDSEANSLFSMFSPPPQRVSISESGGQVLGSTGSSLSEEQRERLERNRMLAIERRKARLTSVQPNATETLLENNERTSQEDPITYSLKQNNMPDNLLENSNHPYNNENDKTNLSELNNQNSDNLGLDDLIDLVDKEDLDSDKITKITNSSSEQSTKISVETTEGISQVSKLSNLEHTVSYGALDDNSNMAVTSKTLGSVEEKNLELDSLMNLINDDSEDCQQYSNSIDTIMHNTHNKNSINGEMSPPMDYEDEKYFNSDPESSSLVIVEDP